MKRRRNHFLYMLPATLVAIVVIAGILFGTNVLRSGQNAGAAPAHVSKIGKMSNFASIIPIQPMWNEAVKMKNVTNAQTVPLPACLASAALPRCYSPQQMRQAYGVQTLLNEGITGQGMTITIVEGSQDPTIQTDLQLFDSTFGLPNAQLNVISPFGVVPFNPNDPAQTGIATETALDVEWAHVMAPDATLDVVIGSGLQATLPGSLKGVLQATQFAVQNNIGNVISQSYGASEQCLGTASIQQMHAIFQQAVKQKQTVLASIGDSGAGVVQCNANGQAITLAQGVNYPASDPLVTGVGGTTLSANANGVYQSETTWNEAQQGAGATGGGVSKIFQRPGFQKNIQNATRGVGDISFDADPLTSVPVVSSSSVPGTTMIIPVGGTSLGAPAVAGMVALFDQFSGGINLGFLNSALYRISRTPSAYAQSFHDIQSGNNTFVFQGANATVVSIPGFKALAGWDSPTGLGTPDAVNMAKLLPQFIKATDGTTL